MRTRAPRAWCSRCPQAGIDASPLSFVLRTFGGTGHFPFLERPAATPQRTAMKKRSTKKVGAPASARPRVQKLPEPIELPAPKRGRGRPTTYDPAMCERVIELGEEGKSKAQIAQQ